MVMTGLSSKLGSSQTRILWVPDVTCLDVSLGVMTVKDSKTLTELCTNVKYFRDNDILAWARECDLPRLFSDIEHMHGNDWLQNQKIPVMSCLKTNPLWSLTVQTTALWSIISNFLDKHHRAAAFHCRTYWLLISTTDSGHPFSALFFPVRTEAGDIPGWQRTKALCSFNDWICPMTRQENEWIPTLTGT